MFDVDRFYVDYPVYGLIKLCTLGGFFFLYFLDIVLIALQIVYLNESVDCFYPCKIHHSSNLPLL